MKHFEAIDDTIHFEVESKFDDFKLDALNKYQEQVLCQKKVLHPIIKQIITIQVGIVTTVEIFLLNQIPVNK